MHTGVLYLWVPPGWQRFSGTWQTAQLDDLWGRERRRQRDKNDTGASQDRTNNGRDTDFLIFFNEREAEA